MFVAKKKQPTDENDVQVVEPSGEEQEDSDSSRGFCGDGEINQSFEECDDGDANADDSPNACREDCTLPFCGDGVYDDETEDCDDGNYWNLDGCSSECIVEDGDFEQEPNPTLSLAEDRGREHSFLGSLSEYDRDCFLMPFGANDYADFSIQGEIIINEEGEEEEVCSDYFHLNCVSR